MRIAVQSAVHSTYRVVVLPTALDLMRYLQGKGYEVGVLAVSLADYESLFEFFWDRDVTFLSEGGVEELPDSNQGSNHYDD